MIIEYIRPKTLNEAVSLISRDSPETIPMGGGTSLKRRSIQEDFSVVDLQALNLDQIISDATRIELGAMITLQAIGDHPEIPEAIKTAIRLEGTANTRNQATLGGRLVAFNGRSALITTLMAADAITIWDETRKEVSLGEWLALPESKPGKLLLAIKINCKTNLALEVVNKTKLDLPLVCVAAAKWPAGRIRLAVGGFGKCPQMVFDGPDGDGAELAVENACRNSGDFRAGADYRRAMSIILTRRCLEKIKGS
jgi:putative selenate reductase FAD-binding subunit